MKKQIFNLLLFLLTINVFSQSRIDANFVFKLQYFLDYQLYGKISFDSQSYTPKNDSLFKDYMEKIEFKLDTLNAVYDKSSKLLADDFSFYTISEFTKYRGTEFGIYTNKHILAVNTVTGVSYRLKGFGGNDFLQFLKDFKERYRYLKFNNISTKKFLKKYKVEGLDFKCIYKGLKSKKRDIDKYPCLRSIHDIIVGPSYGG